MGLGGGYLVLLDREIVSRFEGRRWRLPSKIYSDTFSLYTGGPFRGSHVRNRLRRLGYQPTKQRPPRQGEYRVGRGFMEIALHDFLYPGGEFEGFPVRIETVEGTDQATPGPSGTGQGDLHGRSRAGVDHRSLRTGVGRENAGEPFRGARTYGGRGHRGRGPSFLRTFRPRSFLHRQGLARQPRGRKNRAGGQHADPATGQELLPDAQEDLVEKGQGSLDGTAPGDPVLEGADPGGLPERDLLRPEGIAGHLWGRRGFGVLFRQARSKADLAGERFPGRTHKVSQPICSPQGCGEDSQAKGQRPEEDVGLGNDLGGAVQRGKEDTRRGPGLPSGAQRCPLLRRLSGQGTGEGILARHIDIGRPPDLHDPGCGDAERGEAGA